MPPLRCGKVLRFNTSSGPRMGLGFCTFGALLLHSPPPPQLAATSLGPEPEDDPPHNISTTYYTILYYTILYYTILCYTILYYTILYYTILYYTILYYTILYYTILYYTILYYTILYYTILYYTILILYYTILFYFILYKTVLYYTILYYTILFYTILFYSILYYTILYYTILFYSIQNCTVLYYKTSFTTLRLPRMPTALSASMGPFGHLGYSLVQWAQASGIWCLVSSDSPASIDTIVTKAWDVAFRPQRWTLAVSGALRAYVRLWCPQYGFAGFAKIRAAQVDSGAAILQEAVADCSGKTHHVETPRSALHRQWGLIREALLVGV